MWIGACKMAFDDPVGSIVFENCRYVAGIKDQPSQQKPVQQKA